MVRVERVKRPAKRSKRVELSEDLALDVEQEGAAYTFKHERRVVGRVSGDFVEACVLVKGYKVCFAKSELEELFKGE
jgi:hypothetical protein